MEKELPSGTIFISHASLDKKFVELVTNKIPKSHLFYDVDTINPGRHTIDELDDGLLTASVFAMFVSPNTAKSVWVDYESGIAYVQKIKRNHLNVVAIPIKGATYKDAPEWMHKYMAVPPGYTHSDIARLLKNLYEDSLRNQGLISPQLFVGRESLCNKLVVDIKTRSVSSGIPVNFLILAGIPNMGRFSVAKNVVSRIFPGARNDSPVFDLHRYADAIDLFIALRQDISGDGGKAWSERQILEFPKNPIEQSEILMANLSHYAKINQTVVVRSGYGLRNQTRILKDWLRELFLLLRTEPNIRVIWISDRMLPEEEIRPFENVFQLHVPELNDSDIVYLLTEMLDVSTSSPSPSVLQRIAPHIHGHPGSAHYVARLINGASRAPESLLEKPESIVLFQQECIKGAISQDSIGQLGQQIILLLRLLPWASYDLITNIFVDFEKTEISQTLWDMTDNCILNYSMSAGYRLAEIIRINSSGDADLSTERMERLGEYLKIGLKSESSNQYAVEALVFVFVRLQGHIPEEFKTAITGATLLDVVEQYYGMGHKLAGNWAESFRTAARLSLLGLVLPMSVDTLETILFNGADSLIRVGDDPHEIIQEMRARNLPSVNYILGSYYYHQKRDPDMAIEYLELAMKVKSYTKRTGRLLAKIYMERGKPKAGLQVFQAIGETRVNRDAGLLAQKIKCLRACGQNADANKLVLAMRSLEDEFGEYEALSAARSMKEGKHDEALEYISKARLKPKANRINLKLLETAIQIEKGDSSNLEETCKLATAIGLDVGASSLRARAYIKSGYWQSAESELTKISSKNYYDNLLVLRMLEMKKDDLEVVADPALRRATIEQYQKLLVQMKKAGDGDWGYADF